MSALLITCAPYGDNEDTFQESTSAANVVFGARISRRSTRLHIICVCTSIHIKTDGHFRRLNAITTNVQRTSEEGSRRRFLHVTTATACTTAPIWHKSSRVLSVIRNIHYVRTTYAKRTGPTTDTRPVKTSE